MNNVDLMMASIDRDPDDLTAVAALTDALIEERDMTRSEADRCAESVVRCARDARDTAAAAAVLARADDLARRIHLAAIDQAGVAAHTPATLVIGICDMTVAENRVSSTPLDYYWQHVTIVVDARWVLAMARALTPTLPTTLRRGRAARRTR